MVVGGTIGVGIFLTPAGMAKSLGSPGLLLAVWVFLAAMALCGRALLRRAGRALPGGGRRLRLPARGVRPRASRSSTAGSACSSWIRASPPRWPPALGAYAAVARARRARRRRSRSPRIAWSPLANLAGVRLAAGVAQVLAVAKVGVLAGAGGARASLGRRATASRFAAVLRAPARARRALLPALAGAVVSGFFSFGGWWEASKLAGEVEDAPRNVPRALIARRPDGDRCSTCAVSAVFLFLVPLDGGARRARPSRRRRARRSSAPRGRRRALRASSCCPCWAACSRS